MGNSTSTTQTYQDEIDQSMKDKIKESGMRELGAVMGQQNVAQDVAAATSDGLDLSDLWIYTFMSEFASDYFPLSFGYSWSNTGADKAKRPDLGFCSISTPVGSQIPEYLEAKIFGKLGLPAWVEQQAIPGLVETITKLVSDSKEPLWNAVPFSQTYDSPVGHQDDWRLDVIIVCVEGALTFDGLRAGFSLIYYLGVFYPVQSDTKSTRDYLRSGAYSIAVMYVDPRPTTDAELLDALKLSGTPEFQNKFGFSYGSTPPESLRAEGLSSAYLNYDTQLIYVPAVSPGQEYWSTSIEQGLFSGLNIPALPIKEEAISDLSAYCQEVLSRSDSWLGQQGYYVPWITSSIDRLYYLANPTLNPIRQKSILMSWYQYLTNSDGLKISVTYIFMQTMFYEELPVEQRAVRRLFQILCDKIRQELQRPPVPDDDLLSLKEMLTEYAGMQFQSSFGFAYNGDDSDPPDRRPGGAVKGYDELLQTKTSPTPVEEVEKWLDAEVFQKDSLTFPTFANNKIWEKIRDDVVGFTDPAASGNWYTASNSTIYQHPDGGTNIKQYSQYVYAVGELELDGVNVTRVFVCYLGVYCGTTNTG